MLKFIPILLLFFPLLCFSQEVPMPGQNIRGKVHDTQTGQTLDSVSVVLQDKKAYTDQEGSFTLKDIPVGRYTITFTKSGFKPYIIKELFVGSGKEVQLEISLSPDIIHLKEVNVSPKVNKSSSINDRALVGAQMFSVEEASRFAGGMDDPARLMSAYAGVTLPNLSNNGISVHGNNPDLLQWRLEGVEIPNPNHFANMEVLGGGFLSALSSNVLGNSDFLLGAFPAEYNNAISGVFDMKLRTGNRYKHEYTLGIGMLGIDLATEGPFNAKHRSSYLVNYRYATTKLLEQLAGRDQMGGTLGYQDLNFKLHFPSQNGHVFSVWGTGLLDEVDPILVDPEDWKYAEEGLLSSAKQQSGAIGITHRYHFKDHKSSIFTSLATTYRGSDAQENLYDQQEVYFTKTRFKNQMNHLILSSILQQQITPKHNNITGITLRNLSYDMRLDIAEEQGSELINYVQSSGNTQLISAYTHSKINLSVPLTLSAGINAQYLSLSRKLSVEPRVNLKWDISPKGSIALGYGLHSKMEDLDVYFVKDSTGNTPNNTLGFTKSNHFLLALNYNITPDLHVKIAPYYQVLFNVPVSPQGTYSLLNRKTYYLTETLVNKGKGINYGIDFTLEKYFTNKLYYVLSASLFNSKYQGEQKRWFSTRYNRTFALNALIGKEWIIRSNILSVNIKSSFMGGDRYTPVDKEATLNDPEKSIHYDMERPFSQQFSPMFIGDFTISYKLNRRSSAHEFAIKSVNATKQKEYVEHRYNIHSKEIETYRPATSLFNVSYKIEF